MAKKKETPEERLNEYGQFYGVSTLNLIIERHILSEDKRRYFTIRFVEKDEQKEKEYTEIMEKIGEKIYKIDEKLYEIGIEPKDRINILRDIKKAYPNYEWLGGLTEA